MSGAKRSIGTIDVTDLANMFYGGSNQGRRVCIVGGGIGGLTAALAFARSGAHVELHEQAPAFTEVGAGIQITPNGARGLEVLGLGAALDAGSIPARAVEPLDALTGRVVTRFDLRQIDGPSYRFFHRAGLLDILVKACDAAGVNIRLGSDVDATLQQADLVIGAEGIHSTTRTHLNREQAPFFTGQVAWRALVRHDAAPVARIWMAPGRHVVTYPLPGGLLNVVAVQERQQWAAEGWAHRDDPGNLRHAFRHMCPELKALLDKIEDVHLWGLYRHDVAQVWGRDNLFILGDAAHPTLPFLAQGANLAIEDAVILARCCDAGSVAQAQRVYRAMRRDRVTRAIAAANANARNYHLSGVARRTAHTGLKTIGIIAPKMFLKRMEWLYGYDVRGVALRG